MRLPLFAMCVACALLGGTLYWATDTYAWPFVGAVVFVTLFLLAEWCVDSLVREFRKARLRG